MTLNSMYVTWLGSTNRNQLNPSESMLFVRVFCQLFPLHLSVLVFNTTSCGYWTIGFAKDELRIHVPRTILSNATCSSFDKQCAQGLFYHMTPLPHPSRRCGKKADMFERNVLVKKYRGGRQEDYLKKGFALFLDLPADLCIYFGSRFLCRALIEFN